MNAMHLIHVAWDQMSLNTTSNRRYCPVKAEIGLCPVIWKRIVRFVKCWMLLNMPFRVGFPAWYAPTIIWQNGISYPLNSPLLGWGRNWVSLGTLSTLALAIPFICCHFVASSSLCNPPILPWRGREAGCWWQQQERLVAMDLWGGLVRGISGGDPPFTLMWRGARYGRWSWRPVGGNVFWLCLLVASTNS